MPPRRRMPAAALVRVQEDEDRGRRGERPGQKKRRSRQGREHPTNLACPPVRVPTARWRRLGSRCRAPAASPRPGSCVLPLSPAQGSGRLLPRSGRLVRSDRVLLIAQISDVHLGGSRYDEPLLHTAIAEINTAKPDLVVVAGDRRPSGRTRRRRRSRPAVRVDASPTPDARTGTRAGRRGSRLAPPAPPRAGRRKRS